MSVNNENEFRRLILDSARKNSKIHVVDIPDDAKRIVAIHPECANLIAEKVYDFGLLKNGKYVGVELKNENKSLTWNISNMRPHQIKYLKEVVKCGGRGLVLIRFKKAIDTKAQKRLGLVGKWAIDTVFICDIMLLTKSKQTSFSYEYLRDNFDELELCEFTKKYDIEKLWKKTTKSPKKL